MRKAENEIIPLGETFQTCGEWLKGFTEKVHTAFRGVEAKYIEARAMLKYADELRRKEREQSYADLKRQNAVL